MRQGFGGSVVATIIVFVLQLYAPALASAEASQVTMSQVIRPLYCTVDVTTDGLQLHVELTPEICTRSAKARQLLAETRASLHL